MCGKSSIPFEFYYLNLKFIGAYEGKAISLAHNCKNNRTNHRPMPRRLCSSGQCNSHPLKISMWPTQQPSTKDVYVANIVNYCN
jgi:hypothetical protein